MKATIIKVDGTESEVEVKGVMGISAALGCDMLDTVNLRDGRVMLVDDVGHIKELPINPKATAIYHGICRQGTTHTIRGDVAIALDADFGPPY